MQYSLFRRSFDFRFLSSPLQKTSLIIAPFLHIARLERPKGKLFVYNAKKENNNTNDRCGA